MNKIINSVCICGDRLYKTENEFIVILPCQHLIHSECIKHIENVQCPYCSKHIKNIRTFSEIVDIIKKTNNRMYHQIYIDMMTEQSIENIDNISYSKLLINLPGVIDTLFNIIVAQDRSDFKFVMDEFLETCNIHIHVKNKEKILNNTKIIISNHVNHLDAMVIYKIFGCSFLGSSVMKDDWLGKKIINIFPTLLIKRNNSKNVVDTLRHYVRNNGDICIFPEGYMSHHDILCRFRTGAFHIGYPVQPVVLKYTPVLSCTGGTSEYISKIFSQNRIDITAIILDPIHPPFDKNKIEYIRNLMAQTGNLALSRISNRDIIDD